MSNQKETIKQLVLTAAVVNMLMSTDSEQVVREALAEEFGEEIMKQYVERAEELEDSLDNAAVESACFEVLSDTIRSVLSLPAKS